MGQAQLVLINNSVMKDLAIKMFILPWKLCVIRGALELQLRGQSIRLQMMKFTNGASTRYLTS